MEQRRHGVTAGWSNVLDVAIPPGLGLIFFAGSADHVYHLAVTNGQTDIGAWSIVGSMEILAIWLGLEAKRRSGVGRMPALIGLALATSFVLAANLASAVPTTWARIMAVSPAAALVVLVAVIETRGMGKQRARRPRVAEVRKVQDATPEPTRKPVGRSAKMAAMPDDRPAKPDGRLAEVRAEWMTARATGTPMPTIDVAKRLGVKLRMAQIRVKEWGEEV